MENNTIEFVKHVLQQICEHTEDIKLEETHDDKGTLISIQVNEADMGKIIGKNGQTISALRLLVRSMGAKNKEKINLKVLENS